MNEQIKRLITALDCTVERINQVKMIKLSLDVTKIKKENLIKGQKGTYLNLVIFETPDNEFSTHIAKQDLGKDSNGEYIKSDIIGSAKRWKDKEEEIKVEDNDLPF